MLRGGFGKLDQKGTNFDIVLAAAEPNKGMEPTAYSVRSFLAPASGSGSYLALDAKGTKTKTAGQSQT